MTRLLLTVSVAASLLIAGGCGKRQTVLYDMPRPPQAGYYEVAWVDPQIIASDSLYTLIRADRIDSFHVDKPSHLFERPAPSLTFTITQERCFTTVNLLNGRSEIVRALVARYLPKGYYKLAFNSGQLSIEDRQGESYYLKAAYCGFSVIEQIVRR